MLNFFTFSCKIGQNGANAMLNFSEKYSIFHHFFFRKGQNTLFFGYFRPFWGHFGVFSLKKQPIPAHPGPSVANQVIWAERGSRI